MKKLILLIALTVIIMSANAQVALKGIALGEIYLNNKDFNTTIATVPGIINVRILNDNRVHLIAFEPIDEYGSPTRITPEESSTIIKGLERKYSIKFNIHKVNDYSTTYVYEKQHNGVIYHMDINYNKFLFPSTSLSFWIGDIKLGRIYMEESVYSDF